MGSPRFRLLLTQFVGHIVIFDLCPERRTACTPSAPLYTYNASFFLDGVNKLVNQIHQSQYNPHSDNMYESTIGFNITPLTDLRDVLRWQRYHMMP